MEMNEMGEPGLIERGSSSVAAAAVTKGQSNKDSV